MQVRTGEGGYKILFNILILINDLIEKARIKTYLKKANEEQDNYQFNIAAEFNDSQQAVNYLYQNDNIDILIIEDSVYGIFSGQDLNLLLADKFPETSVILITESNAELELVENQITNLSAVLDKLSSGDVFLNSLFMTAVKQYNKKESIQDEKEKLEDYCEIIDHTHDSVYLLKVNQEEEVFFKHINKTTQQKTGLSSSEVIDKTPIEVFGEELGSRVLENYKKCIKEKKKIKYRENINFKKEKGIFETTLYPIIKDGKVVKIAGASAEITDSLNKEEKWRYKEKHDRTTDLYNSYFFMDITAELENKEQFPYTVAAVKIDSLDIHRKIFGFKSADELLKKTAEVIDNQSGRKNPAFRIGEDAFAAVLSDYSTQQVENLQKELTQKLNNLTLDSINFDFTVELLKIEHKQENREDYLNYIYEKLINQSYNNSLSSSSNYYKSLLKIIEKKGYSVVRHSDKLIDLTEKTADYFELAEDDKKNLILLSQLHDIGKVAFNKTILKKGDFLNQTEWMEYKRHVDKSAALPAEYHDLDELYSLIYHHHEHFDGSGYPDGLKEEGIPYLNRIFSVINFYDALSTNLFYPFLEDQFYFAKLNNQEIIKELNDYKGIIFDPEVVDKFVEMLSSASANSG